jgi:hypothetical protein
VDTLEPGSGEKPARLAERILAELTERQII